MLIVYTAIMGGFNDQLRPVHQLKSRGDVRYICFSDTYIRDTNGWEVEPPIWVHENPRRTARWHKIMAHAALSDYPHTYSLWCDGSHQPIVDPWKIVENHWMAGLVDLASFKHKERSTVSQELVACLQLKKDDPAVMKLQIERYRREKFPDTKPLFETSVVLRRATSKLYARLNETWWKEVEHGSMRDQLSVNYAVWKNDAAVTYIDGCRTLSPYFKFFSHRP